MQKNNNYEPEKGYQRDYLVCTKCGGLSVHDFVPYSFSTAIRIVPCHHDLREQRSVDKRVWVALYEKNTATPKQSD